MIIRCENCSGALKYDVATGKMKCEYCGGLYDTQDVEGEVYQEETMECSVLTCTACGAELMVNKVEAATYCAYCGQPTIVFSRVSKMVRPDKIIPFSISKRQAIAGIKSMFRRNYFIPDAIKNFKEEQVHGIYIPYWLYDVIYCDRQQFRGKKNGFYHNYEVEAKCEFKNQIREASARLRNDLTDRLTPYILADLQDFEEDYLSGFYADKYDVASWIAKDSVLKDCESTFNRKIQRQVPAEEVMRKSSVPAVRIDKEEYILLPAWFVTFRHENVPYTLIVNGQVGKIIGAVPVDKSKIIKYFFKILPICAVICIIISVLLFKVPPNSKDYPYAMITYICILLLAVLGGKSSVDYMKGELRRMSSKELISFYGKRQKGD